MLLFRPGPVPQVPGASESQDCLQEPPGSSQMLSRCFPNSSQMLGHARPANDRSTLAMPGHGLPRVAMYYSDPQWGFQHGRGALGTQGRPAGRPAHWPASMLPRHDWPWSSIADVGASARLRLPPSPQYVPRLTRLAIGALKKPVWGLTLGSCF